MENILAPIETTNIRKITAYTAAARRLGVDGFSGRQRRWLMALIAVQVTCQKLLLVDGAIAMRKMIERQKRSWARHS